MKPRLCFAALLLAMVSIGSCTDPTVPANELSVRSARTTSSGPTVKSTFPSSAPQNITLDVSITGSGFEPGSVAQWMLNGVPDPRVTTNSSVVVNSTSMTANITIAEDAVPALYDVAVITPMGKKGIGTEKFTVLAIEQLSAPAGSSGAHDINSAGAIAGSIAGGCDGYNLPAIWTNGAPSTLPLPQGLCRGRALRISDAGIVIGQAYPSGATSLTESVPLIWKPDGTGYSVQELGVTEYGRPYDIQSANEASHAVVMIGIYYGKAYWWSEVTGFVLLKYPANSTGCYLDDVSDNDEIVGSCQYEFPNSTPSRITNVVYWPSPTADPVVLPRMAGYNYAHMPSAINNNGIVVGQLWNSTRSGLKIVGARWIRSGSTWTVELLPTLGGETYPMDITDDGWVTGRSGVSGSKSHAFLWKAGSLMRDLGAIGSNSNAEAIALSSSGEKLIVGSSSLANDDRAVLWYPDR
ncbi:MAG TPA: hypothetical protein VFD22_03280 [Gemmatimonadaceae bacterium]|nr:hypothetical protein [Gemmatimonadaceae bacterium]